MDIAVHVQLLGKLDFQGIRGPLKIFIQKSHFFDFSQNEFEFAKCLLETKLICTHIVAFIL